MAVGDISWQLLRRIVREWAGESAELNEVKPLHGGAIDTTLLLTTCGGDRAVIKLSPHRVNRHYPAESLQLELLRSIGVPTPAVYCVHLASLDDPDSYLLMEFVEGVTLAEAKQQCSTEQFDGLQCELADLVLLMHEQASEGYGRIASDPPSPMYQQWPAFYRDCYEPIWQEVWKDSHLPGKLRKQIAKIHGKLDHLLSHDDCPRLTHWDLWANNILCRCDADGRWKIAAIIDPECKWAHAEAEIAYLELFKTSTSAFNRRYQQCRKLGDDYHRIRRPIYQLYNLVNHLHLFGAEYLPRLQLAVDQASAVV